MESKIEENLKNPNISSQQDLKAFVKNMQAKIMAYEMASYDKEENCSQKIKNWRSRLMEIIKQYKELPENTIEDSQDIEGIETLKMLNKQLGLADSNQRILDKSTLKLIGLDYSSNDIEKAIVSTRKKLENSRKKEKEERRRLFYSFIFFIGVCLYIIVDKIRIKF